MPAHSGLSMQQISAKNLYSILPFTAQFHNALSNFENLAWGRQALSYRNPQLYSEYTNLLPDLYFLFRIVHKRNI